MIVIKKSLSRDELNARVFIDGIFENLEATFSNCRFRFHVNLGEESTTSFDYTLGEGIKTPSFTE